MLEYRIIKFSFKRNSSEIFHKANNSRSHLCFSYLPQISDKFLFVGGIALFGNDKNIQTLQPKFDQAIVLVTEDFNYRGFDEN